MTNLTATSSNHTMTTTLLAQTTAAETVLSGGNALVSAALNPIHTFASFAPEVSYATGSSPQSVTSLDANDDGKMDLAVANYYSGTVSVLLNNGNGTFAAKVDYATGSSPWSVTSLDANGDGKMDLAVTNGAGVSVLLGKGDGTFATKVDYATGSSPQSVTSLDANADGKMDLVVANTSSGTISVLLGKGDGTFATKVDYATGSYPKSVTSLDANADGKMDLAVVNSYSNTISVLLGKGDGTFATKVDYATGSMPLSVTSLDANADGKMDLAVANYSSSTVSVLLNITSAPASTVPTMALSSSAVSISEGNTASQPLTFTVNLSAAATSAVSVNYATANGSATAGSDYTATSGVLTFAAGETSKTVAVSVLGDTVVEANETFTLNLSSPSGATLGSVSSTTATIVNDDSPQSSTSSHTNVYISATTPQAFTIANSGMSVFGGANREVITINAGVNTIKLDQNIDRVNLPGAANNFTFKQAGNQLVVSDISGANVIVTLPLQGDSDGTQIGFFNGVFNAKLSAGVMSLGGAVINSTTPTGVSPLTLTTTVEPVASASSSASAYLQPNDVITIANSGAKVFGNSGIEVLTLTSATSGIAFDQNMDRINLPGSQSNYKFLQTGNQINVYDALGTTLIAKGPVQGDADGTLLSFDNGMGSVLISGGVMTLGGAAVSKTTPAGIGGSTTAPTFDVTNAAGIVTFSGNATGDITFSLAGSVATFTRGGVTATTTADLATITKMTVGSGQTLAATAAQVTGKTIDGAGAVTITALESTLAANMAGITATTVSVSFAGANPLPQFTGNLGNANLLVTGTSGTGVDLVNGNPTIGANASFHVASLGTSLWAKAADLTGKTVTGSGALGLFTTNANAVTLNPQNVASTIHLGVTISETVDVSSNAHLSAVGSFSVYNGQRLTLTADQADGTLSTGQGSVTVTGSAKAQTFTVSTTGLNTITPGAGADQVTLGTGVDTVVLKFGAAGNPSTQTIAISDAQAATVTQFSIVLDSADNTQDVTLTNAAIAATNGASLAAAIQTQLRAAVPFTYTEASYAAGVITISEWAGRAISATNLKTTSSTSVGTVSTALNGNESTRSDSYVGAYDTIGSFTVGTDKIDLLNSAGNAIAAPTALTRFADVDGALVTTHQELINRVLNSSSFSNTGANKAGMIVVTNGAYAGGYLFINDSVAALDSGTDLFVKLVGTTGLGNVGALTVSDYFA